MQLKKCSGQVIPLYKIKKTTINTSSIIAADAINKIAEDGPLTTYISYEEIGVVCMDCKGKDCGSNYEAR